MIVDYFLYYSNFDKGHYKDFHRVQYNKPTSLALDNFQGFFFSNSKKFLVVIENAMANDGLQFFMQITHLTVLWMSVGRQMQNVTFSKFHLKSFISPIFQKIRNQECV